MNILISAYAVSPNHGSEPGVGWHWVTEIAKYCKVYVITESEFKLEIEEAILDLPQKDNISFYFNDIGAKARIMCWNQGDYRFYYYYRKWQQQTYSIAKNIIANHKIDIIHHLNMIGYREPGYFHKIKDIPFIWGPIGGYVFVEPSFLLSLGIKKSVFYTIKNLLNYIQATLSIRVKKSITRANLLLAASGNTKRAIWKYYNKDSIILNETGCTISDMSVLLDSKKVDQESFDILWVGRFIPTKMLDLALKVISNVKHLEGITLHIVGNGNSGKSINHWMNQADKVGVSSVCKWYGAISHKEVQDLMQSSDLLLFTSIVEGTSHVILESISNHLPILCFDSCGHGEIVDNTIGCKIPLTNPKLSLNAFTKEIQYFYNNRNVLNEMSKNCASKIDQLSWEGKGKQIINYYQDLIK